MGVTPSNGKVKERTNTKSVGAEECKITKTFVGAPAALRIS